MTQCVAYRCNVVDDFRPSYVIIAIMWHVALFWWFFYVRPKYKRNLQCLHHVFSILPLLKTVETTGYFFITLKCPWARSDYIYLRGLEYSVIFLSGTYETVLLGSMLVLSKVALSLTLRRDTM